MSTKNLIYINIITILILCFNIFAENPENNKLSQNTSILTSEEVVSKAIEYLGIQKFKDFNIDKAITKTESIILHDSTTPFVGELMNGKPVWEVVFNVDFDFIDEKYLRGDDRFIKGNAYIKDIHIYLDKESGILLKINVIKSGVSENELPILPPQKVVEEKYSVAEQKYHDFPQKTEISFIEALIEAGHEVANMKDAIMITALYINYSNFKVKVKPVWDIHLYGIKHALGERRKNIVPEYQRNHLRIVIDAATGKLLFAVGSPHPLERILDK